jgi:hypothetical protein
MRPNRSPLLKSCAGLADIDFIQMDFHQDEGLLNELEDSASLRSVA